MILKGALIVYKVCRHLNYENVVKSVRHRQSTLLMQSPYISRRLNKFSVVDTTCVSVEGLSADSCLVEISSS